MVGLAVEEQRLQRLALSSQGAKTGKFGSDNLNPNSPKSVVSSLSQPHSSHLFSSRSGGLALLVDQILDN